MQENRRSVGGALIEVFDAGVVLVKTEARALIKQGTEIVKAKGMGVVFLLAAVAPLAMALIFLILAVFYLLSLFMPAWAAALLVALLGLIVAGALVALGLSRLKAEPEIAEDEVAGTPYDRPRQPGAARRLDEGQGGVPARDLQVNSGAAVVRPSGSVHVHGHPDSSVRVTEVRADTPATGGGVIAGSAVHGSGHLADVQVANPARTGVDRTPSATAQAREIEEGEGLPHGPNPTSGTRLSQSMLHTEVVQGDSHEETTAGAPVSVKPTANPDNHR